MIWTERRRAVSLLLVLVATLVAAVASLTATTWTQRGNDTFSDSNGVALENHTPTAPGGAVWDARGDTAILKIASNGVHQLGDTPDFALFSPTLQNDQRVTFEVTGRGSQPSAVLRGAKDGSSNLTGYVCRVGDVSGTGAYIEKFTGSGTTRTTLASSSTTWLNSPDTADCQIVGTTITLFRCTPSCVQDVTTTDSSYTSGKAGLGGVSDGVGSPMLDNWVVYDAAPESGGGGGSGGLTNRNILTEPMLPTLGAAGSIYIDPTFGTRILRVTDVNTLSEDQSYTTPSASHQLAWNSTGTRFYVGGSFGRCMPFTFNRTTMQATRIAGAQEGGLILQTTVSDCQFSFLDPDIIYVVGVNGSNKPVIKKYNFASPGYTDVLDLSTIATLPAESYVHSLFTSATLPEKMTVIFGGASQDADYLVLVFETATPSNYTLIDVVNSTIIVNGGAPSATNITLGFHGTHHSQIDRSGRYLVFDPVNADLPAQGGTKEHNYVIDLQTNTIAGISVSSYGHSALGYGYMVNQDCCTTPATYDSVQFQIRALNDVGTPHGIVKDVMTPQETYTDGHCSWNNVTTNTLELLICEVYRAYDGPNDINPPYAQNSNAWRAWDDEIIGIQTDATGSTTTVHRYAHHRSNVRIDGDTANVQYFYYQPRVNGDPTGHFAMYTTNYDKTLGMAEGINRHDVFIVELQGATLPVGVVVGRRLF